MFLNTKYQIKYSVALIFAGAIVLQAFHMVEHFAQLHQHAFLGLSIPESNGLITALNLEEIHWIYNLTYFIMLMFVFKYCSFFDLQNRTDGQKVAILSFNTAFFLQGYHLVEHTVRMAQYFNTGCTPCVGILGIFFDGVYLHFVVNFLVFVFPFCAFFVFGFYKKCFRK